MKIDWKKVWPPFDKWIESNRNMGCGTPGFNRIQSVIENSINSQFANEEVIPNTKVVFARLRSWIEAGLVYPPDLERIKVKIQALMDAAAKKASRKS